MELEMAMNQQIPEPTKEDNISHINMIDEEASLGESEIQKLFNGATVLVTGGTGFLGKQLIEKLLRSCNGLRKIYILARSKKNKDPAQRLEEQFRDVLYNKLKKQQPEYRKKVVIIEGDVGKIDLGISEENRKTLINEVNFIFHSAAIVSFDMSLKTAVEINVRGTREMLLLAKACTNLEAVVHISTAYSNCPKKEIHEKFYDRKLSGDKLIELVANLDDEMIKKIIPNLLGDYPNTYAYSKSAGEDIVRQYSKGLPVAVCRPSMVVCTAKDPIPGWIDNINGPSGVLIGSGLGILHVINCDPNITVDLIPVDMAVNCCIAAAWKVAKDNVNANNNEGNGPLELPPRIYNIVSSARNRVRWVELQKMFFKKISTYASTRALWYPFVVLTRSVPLFTTLNVFLHWIPAYILDGIAVLTGKKPMLKKIYSKIGKFMEVIIYFMTNEWKFHDENCLRLYKEMCDADKQIFEFDITSLDWDEFTNIFCLGLRVHIAKDSLDTLSLGQKKYRIFQVAHYLICATSVLALLRLIRFIVRFLF